LKVSVPVPCDEAIVRATGAHKAQGFGVLTTIDVKQTLKAKRPGRTVFTLCGCVLVFGSLNAFGIIGLSASSQADCAAGSPA
jgi:uncharacterized protein (DUF302 family)